MSERFQHEVEFHDKILGGFKDKDTLIAPYFEAPTAVENRYILSQVGNLRDKRVLDFACGIGEASVYFALKGSKTTGIDVSPKAIEIARDLASQNGVQVDFVVSRTESLAEFSDNSFDLIYGNGALHHVDCEKYFPEFRRVLKPGGKAYFIEPLKYNPIINIYRKIATEVRSPDEKPLGFHEIKLAKKYFKTVTTRGFWFVSLYLFCHFFLFEHSDPNKERYWRKIILDAEKCAPLFRPLDKVDRFLLKICPPLRYLCWNLVVELEKN